MSDESQLWRAQTYALVATLLVKAPDQALLENITNIEVTEPESPMGQQWLQLITACKQAQTEALQQEFHDLFIGITHGELMPYGSYYRTGFLMEEPLAELRTDLAKLGLERQQDTKEPEDHIAALCDVMRLILTAEGTPIVTAELFYNAHLAPWVDAFFTDLVNAKSARFYKALGQFSGVFFSMETNLY
jgi:TorA maturation chaperone TorD